MIAASAMKADDIICSDWISILSWVYIMNNFNTIFLWVPQIIPMVNWNEISWGQRMNTKYKMISLTKINL